MKVDFGGETEKGEVFIPVCIESGGSVQIRIVWFCMTTGGSGGSSSLRAASVFSWYLVICGVSYSMKKQVP